MSSTSNFSNFSDFRQNFRKRACRAHGISRWPCRKLRKISCLDTSLQKLREEMTTGSYISGGSVLTGGTAITTTADTAAQPSVGGAAQLAIDAVQFPKNAPDGVQVQAVDKVMNSVT